MKKTTRKLLVAAVLVVAAVALNVTAISCGQPWAVAVVNCALASWFVLS
jgi:hypothetical protein